MGHGRLAVPGSGRGVCGLDDHVRGGLGRLAGGPWPGVQVRVGSQHDTGVAQCSATRWLGTSASRWVGMTGDGKGPTVAKAGSLERSSRTVGDLDDHGGERCPARCAHGAWCSNACSRDAVDRRRDQGRGETLRPIEQGTRWTTWTRPCSVDEGRFTHNPEVAGCPRYQVRGPFAIGREGAFCMSFVNGFVERAAVHAASPPPSPDALCRLASAARSRRTGQHPRHRPRRCRRPGGLGGRRSGRTSWWYAGQRGRRLLARRAAAPRHPARR